MRNGKQMVIGVVALVMLLSAVSVGFAQTGFWDNVASKLAGILAGQISVPAEESLGDSEPSFGATATGVTRYQHGNLFSLGAITENGFSLVDNWTGTSTSATTALQDGITWESVQIELNATSSAAVINPHDETIYVLNTSYIRIITATTTVVSYQAGTSTTGIVPRETCATTGTCAAASATNAGIINTASTTPVANATFFKEDYDGTVAREFLPVADDEYLTCNVSSTAAAGYTSGGQGANCVFLYFRIHN